MSGNHYSKQVLQLEAILEQRLAQLTILEAENQALKQREHALHSCIKGIEGGLTATRTVLENDSTAVQPPGHVASPSYSSSTSASNSNSGISGSLEQVSASPSETLAVLGALETKEQQVQQVLSQLGCNGGYTEMYTSWLLRKATSDPSRAASFLAWQQPQRLSYMIKCVQKMGVLLPKYDSTARATKAGTAKEQLDAVVDALSEKVITCGLLDPPKLKLNNLMMNLETLQYEPYPEGWWQQVVQAVDLTPEQKAALQLCWIRVKANKAALTAHHEQLSAQLAALQQQQQQEHQRFEQEAQQLPLPQLPYPLRENRQRKQLAIMQQQALQQQALQQQQQKPATQQQCQCLQQGSPSPQQQQEAHQSAHIPLQQQRNQRQLPQQSSSVQLSRVADSSQAVTNGAVYGQQELDMQEVEHLLFGDLPSRAAPACHLAAPDTAVSAAAAAAAPAAADAAPVDIIVQTASSTLQEVQQTPAVALTQHGQHGQRAQLQQQQQRQPYGCPDESTASLVVPTTPPLQHGQRQQQQLVQCADEQQKRAQQVQQQVSVQVADGSLPTPSQHFQHYQQHNQQLQEQQQTLLVLDEGMHDPSCRHQFKTELVATSHPFNANMGPAGPLSASTAACECSQHQAASQSTVHDRLSAPSAALTAATVAGACKTVCSPVLEESCSDMLAQGSSIGFQTARDTLANAEELLLQVASKEQKMLEQQLMNVTERIKMQHFCQSLMMHNTMTKKQIGQIYVASYPFIPDALSFCEALDELGWS